MSAPFAFVKSSLTSSRLGFALWGWATLLVVLVSAAPDGGAPGSRDLGSAFDPATPSVAVGPQQPREVAAMRSDDTAPPAPVAGGAGVLLPSLELSSPDAAAGGSLIAHRPHASGDPRSLNRAHGARAPPIA